MFNSFWKSELPYYKGYESFCYQNSLRLILESYGVEYAPLFINASLSLNMDIESDSVIKFVKAESARSFLPEYADKDKRIYYPKNTDPIEVFKENISMVNDKNTAIIVGVDLFHLPYLEYYHKKHGSHTFIMCGADIDDNRIDIIDWYEPWFHKGSMDKDEFLLARNSENPKDEHIYSGKPIRNNWTHISRNGWDADPQYLISSIFKLSKQQFFEPDDNNGRFCFERIVKLLEKFTNDENCHGDTMRVIHRGLFIALKRFKFFKQYLEIAQKYHCNSETLIENIDKYISAFESILMLMYKTTMVNSAKTLERIIGKLKEIDKMHDVIYKSMLETEKAMN